MRRVSVRFQIALLVWLAIVASTAICGRFAVRMTEAATWDLLWQESQSVGAGQVLAWQRAKDKTPEGFVASYRPAKYPDGSEWDHTADPPLWIWEVPSNATSVDMANPVQPVWSAGENPLVTSGQGAGEISGDPSVFPKEATPAFWPVSLSSLEHDFAGSSTLPMTNGKTLVVVETIDTTDARFRVDYQRREALRLGILISLVGAALAWVLAGLTSRPIERLGRAVRAFGDGGGSARAAASGPAEVARLVRDFNAMADRVQATLASQRRFVADTSHELRTPTAALLASSSALDLTAPHDEVLDLMVPQVGRLAGLTEDLLALNRFDEGAQRVDAHEVEVVALVRHAVDEVAAGRDVHVEGEEFRANLDPHRVRLVVRNLVGNALQHGAEPVVVTVSPQDAGARIEVQDAGPGVPGDLREVVFDRFVRGDGARHEGGRGLGLSLARETCRLHGGDLELGAGGASWQPSRTLRRRARCPRRNSPVRDAVRCGASWRRHHRWPRCKAWCYSSRRWRSPGSSTSPMTRSSSPVRRGSGCPSSCLAGPWPVRERWPAGGWGGAWTAPWGSCSPSCPLPVCGGGHTGRGSSRSPMPCWWEPVRGWCAGSPGPPGKHPGHRLPLLGMANGDQDRTQSPMKVRKASAPSTRTGWGGLVKFSGSRTTFSSTRTRSPSGWTMRTRPLNW
ncbi:MAG: HAMP domain-containing histidine kinase [Luteococcus sp.]|uniref:sensor histidine kinase n=1 Tax=Luteococcus sp. TaxID=1969402 RepID=UPI002648E916|nr:HAMP domain-containing sensor histidine kinase [Luteococcus sp.]MDN5563987.1 HAMP domain-containing histidine kinase [Luteococcus sp.]